MLENLEFFRDILTGFADYSATGRNSRTPYHSLYEHTISMAKDMSVHFEYGAHPGELISRARPHEIPTNHEFRVEIYEQVTWGYSQKMINLIAGAIFHPQIYRVSYPDPPTGVGEGEEIEKYLTKELPVLGGNLDDFIRQCYLPDSSVDANAWCVVIPEFSDEELNGDQTRLRRPLPVIIPSENILHYGRDDFGDEYMIALSSDSDIEYDKMGRKKIKNGTYFVFTGDNTYRFTQQEKRDQDGNILWIEEVYHKHEGHKLSDYAWIIGGMLGGKSGGVLSRQSQLFYLPPLSGVLPWFNQALQIMNDLRAAEITHLHPQKWELPHKCDECNGSGKVSHESKDGQYWGTCTTCEGSGSLTSNTSALVAYTTAQDSSGKAIIPAGYIPQDIGIIKQAWESFEKNILEGARSVNMEQLFESEGNANDTATAKEIEREQLHNLFGIIAKIVIGGQQRIIDAINMFRYPFLSDEALEQNRPEVIHSNNFDTTSLSDVIEKFKLAQEGGIHEGALVGIAEEVIHKTFGHGTEDAKFALAALHADPLPFQSVDDLIAWTGALGVDFSETELDLKANLIQRLRQCVEENEGFLDMTPDEQKTLLERKG